jgi:outer membrane receptor protein involved in Fe transport
MIRTGTFVVLVLLAAAAAGAQEASLVGTITDTSGGVLPGVTVTATHVASGNSFSAVSDSNGEYRFLAIRVGGYRLVAELPGFATITREVPQILVGQRAVVDLQLAVSSVQESVTVTGEAPLVDTTRSALGGNIDPRQMQELPVNGRNWLDLTSLAPGARGNAVSEAPLPRDNGAFQLNLDGQQVTSIISASSFGQPRFSREAIAEFQYVTNQFDATQGRSMGVQVNAITKSGTNNFDGSFFGYFRDDSMKAKDFVLDRVTPYSDQQIGGSFGGPIVRDRLQFFGTYEYEREPQSFSFTSPFPSFNLPDLVGARRENKTLARVDAQFTPSLRANLRGTAWNNDLPFTQAGGATNHPSTTSFTKRKSDQLFASVSQILNDRSVNEIKAGYTSFGLESDGYYPSVNIQLRGYSIGSPQNFPQTGGQATWSLRDDFTRNFEWAGSHEMKTGAEYLRTMIYFYWALNSRGSLQADRGPAPANLEQLFPVWDDPATWNLDPLSSISVRFRQAFGNYNIYVPIQTYAAWVQDNWTVSDRLTLNLGLRYDFDKGSLTEDVAIPPFTTTREPDKDNVSPRVGFTYALDAGQTVIRGGAGKFYAQITNNQSLVTMVSAQTAVAGIENDGRPDFASNPWNGRPPSLEEARRQRQDLRLLSPDVETPYAYQGSVGVQRQISPSTAVQADYVYTGSREDFYLVNVNMALNPATGANYPFSDIARRPYPDYGTVAMYKTGGRSNYHGLQTALTKRFSNRWQASATYTVSKMMDNVTPYQASPDNSFDIEADYAPSVADQRHRFVFNGIWSLPYDFQVSGLYFFGSGEHFNNSYGGDLRNTGGFSSGRLRPDGTLVPRNSFVGDPIHRVDMRVSRRFTFAGVSLDGIVEVFNAFNHENFGSYVLQESNRNYALPQPSTALAYQPRMLQLGFRAAF